VAWLPAPCKATSVWDNTNLREIWKKYTAWRTSLWWGHSVQIAQDKVRESGHVLVFEPSFSNRYNVEIMLKTLNILLLAVTVSIMHNGISTETKIKESLLKLYNTITITFVIGFVLWKSGQFHSHHCLTDRSRSMCILCKHHTLLTGTLIINKHWSAVFIVQTVSALFCYMIHCSFGSNKPQMLTVQQSRYSWLIATHRMATNIERNFCIKHLFVPKNLQNTRCKNIK
jgi:hypothetical protein